MSLDPFLEADRIIQLHVVAALIALVLGPIALWRKRRDRLHKIVGYIWVVAMALAAAVSFGIESHFTPVGLGPIHLLAVFALWSLYVAMRGIYRRDIVMHKQAMEGLYVRGLALAGAFNFLPGRTSARALIPDTPELGYVIITAVLFWAFVPLITGRVRAGSRTKQGAL